MNTWNCSRIFELPRNVNGLGLSLLASLFRGWGDVSFSERLLELFRRVGEDSVFNSRLKSHWRSKSEKILACEYAYMKPHPTLSLLFEDFGPWRKACMQKLC